MLMHLYLLFARDFSGRRCVRREFRARPPPVVGEATAVLEALILAKACGWHSIILEGHCHVVIRALQSSRPSLSSFGAIIDDCFAFMCYFSICSFQFVHRTWQYACAYGC